MNRKLIIGLLLFLSGILLQEVSYAADIWIIRLVGGIIWPIGSVLAVNAAVQSKQNKQSEDSPRKKNNNYLRIGKSNSSTKVF